MPRIDLYTHNKKKKRNYNCCKCGAWLGDKPTYVLSANLSTDYYCKADFQIEVKRMAENKKFQVKSVYCAKCHKQLAIEAAKSFNGQSLCDTHYYEAMTPVVKRRAIRLLERAIADLKSEDCNSWIAGVTQLEEAQPPYIAVTVNPENVLMQVKFSDTRYSYRSHDQDGEDYIEVPAKV